jgi:hypothetical protein
MIACPACKRRIFTRREILGAGLDGGAKCGACGQVARLDGMSRYFVASMLALLLWMMLLYGSVFYSGYLFVFSTIVIFGGWRLLAAAALPLLSLEKAPGGTCFDRRQSVVILAIMIVVAIVIDGLMSYRSDADKAHANAASSSASASSK